MADQSTNYVIGVTDGIAASIQPRLQAIGSAAISAGAGVDSLAQSLKKIDVAAVTSALKNVSSAQSGLNTSTRNYAARMTEATTATNTLSNSLVTLIQRAGAATMQMTNLAAATTAYVGGAKGVASASQAFNSAANGFTNVGRAANGSVSEVQAASAALMTLEGRMSIRAVEKFSTAILGLGPMLRAAFPIVGAIALLEVFGRMYDGIMHVVDAYKAMQLESIRATNQVVVDGERIIKVKQASFFSASGLSNFFNNSPEQQPIDVKSAAAALQTITAQKAIAAAQAQVNEAGLTGLALSRQKTKDAQAELTSLKLEKIQVDALTKAYREQSEAKVTVLDPSKGGARDNPGVPAFRDVAKITDPEQQKALQAQIRTTAQESRNLDTQITVATLHLEAMGKKEPLAGLRDEAKAAAAEMKRLNAELNTQKNGNSFVTAQQTLDFYNANRNNLPGNTAFAQDIDAKTGAAAQTVARQKEVVDALTTSLQEQVDAVTAYGDARKIQLAVDKQIAQLQRDTIVISPQLRSEIEKQNTTIVEGAAYQRALSSSYESARGPLQTYTATKRALADLTISDSAHTQQYVEQLYKAEEAYKQATIPLYAYSKSITEQSSLLGLYGTALDNATLKLQLMRELQSQGIDPNSAKGQAALSSGVAAGSDLRRAQDLSSAVGRYDDTDKAKQLTDAQYALNVAMNQGRLYGDEYKIALVSISTAQTDLAIKMGDTSWSSKVTSALGHLTDGYKGFNVGASAALNELYKTAADGAADSLGRAIVYTHDFGAALLDTARQATAQLISALIKLGIQMLIVNVLAKAFHIDLPQKNDADQSAAATAKNTAISLAALAVTTAASYAAATVLAPVWWDVAEAVSLATFGANAIGALAGIATVKAAGSVTPSGAGAPGAATGGYISGPGSGTSDSIPVRVSNGEYIVNARATQDNFALIDAVNNGRKFTPFAQGGLVGTTQPKSSFNMGLTIEDHTTSGTVKWEDGGQDSEGRMRVIARDAVNQHADEAFAGAIARPNSKSNKALRQHTTVRQVR